MKWACLDISLLKIQRQASHFNDSKPIVSLRSESKNIVLDHQIMIPGESESTDLKRKKTRDRNHSSSYSSAFFVFPSLDVFPFTATSSVSNISVAPPVFSKQNAYQI